ncbi:MAG: T9SS type A sorting domain-containing protein, partial [Flavipsychrobacter sp.]
ITVYPNPAKEKVNISITGGYMKDITVMNSVGEIVYRADLSGQVKTADVNVSGLASGRYIIRANTNNGIISKPFNVQQQ